MQGEVSTTPLTPWDAALIAPDLTLTKKKAPHMRGQVMGDSPNVTQIDWPIQWVTSYIENETSA